MMIESHIDPENAFDSATTQTAQSKNLLDQLVIRQNDMMIQHMQLKSYH